MKRKHKHSKPKLNALTRNLDAPNHGTRCRKMNKAAWYLLTSESGASFSTAATNRSRYRIFEKFIKMRFGITSMNLLDRSHIMAYGDHLLDRIEHEELSVKTAKNYLSAINVVHELARRDETLYLEPKEVFPRQSHIRTESRALSDEDIELMLKRLAQLRYDDLYKDDFNLSDRQRMAADRLEPLIQLQFHFGLRIKESILLDAKKAYKRAYQGSEVIVIDRGTKGGRKREVPIRDRMGFDILYQAAKAQGNHNCLIPDSLELYQFMKSCYAVAKMIHLPGFHSLRHHYAQERYREETNTPCPLEANRKHGRDHLNFMAEHLGVDLEESKRIDTEAREQVAEELGHGRKEITNSYTG